MLLFSKLRSTGGLSVKARSRKEKTLCRKKHQHGPPNFQTTRTLAAYTDFNPTIWVLIPLGSSSAPASGITLRSSTGSRVNTALRLSRLPEQMVQSPRRRTNRRSLLTASSLLEFSAKSRLH